MSALEMVPPEDRPAHPHTDASPEWVVRTFLEGVRERDVPSEDDGFRTAYHLTSPDYRAELGFYEGFVQEVCSPFMSMLVDHEAARRGPLDVNDDVTAATQRVCVSDRGDTYLYEFEVEKGSSGKYEGCWLVSGVTLVMETEPESFRHLPTVEYRGTEIKCEPGERLRDVIRRTGDLSPHSGLTNTVNCGGKSTCGTCALEVVNMAPGENVNERTSSERRRLDLPPFGGSDIENLRLSCQTEVHGDVRVRKHAGNWGQVPDRPPADVSWYDEFLDGEFVRVSEAEYDGTGDSGDPREVPQDS